MIVAVDGSLNDPANDNKYFIHQAGVYLALPEQTQPFYSPLVAEHYANGSYSVLIQKPQPKSSVTSDRTMIVLLPFLSGKSISN